MPDPTPSILRIDSFTVPAAAREAFLNRVNATHQILRQQEGFVFDRIAERTLGDGLSRVVTIVEWSRPDAIDSAVRVVKQAHSGDGFSAADFIADNGIAADIGVYLPVS